MIRRRLFLASVLLALPVLLGSGPAPVSGEAEQIHNFSAVRGPLAEQLDGKRAKFRIRIELRRHEGGPRYQVFEAPTTDGVLRSVWFAPAEKIEVGDEITVEATFRLMEHTCTEFRLVAVRRFR